MAMNFAPYQSSPPESTRAFSPPPRSPAASPNPSSRPQARQISSVAGTTDPWAAARHGRSELPLPSPSQFADGQNEGGGGGGAGYYEDIEGQRADESYFTSHGGNGTSSAGQGTDVFETSLGFRMEIEACLAYLLLPPAGGVILLLFEHKSDYVR